MSRRVWAIILATVAIAVLLRLYKTSSPSAAELKFVGSAACASCHTVAYADWMRSHHALAMQVARPGAVAARFDGEQFSYGGVTSTFFKRDGKFFASTGGADGKPHDFEIRYTFGVEPLQQYLVELTGGRIQPLPMAWDTRPASAGGQRWFELTPGAGITQTDEHRWTGRQQNWNYMCADCHSTGVRKGYDPVTDQFNTRWSEINVGCEACHGAGSRHVTWARYPKLFRATLWRANGLPAQLTERRDVRWAVDTGGLTARRTPPRTTQREIESCAPCHSRRTQVADGYVAGSPLTDYYVPSVIMPALYYADGQQRDEVYTYGSFLQSRMNHAGVTCSDCHDPHSQRLRARGNAVCTQCHLAARYDTIAHTFHAAGTAGASCASCHMPATNYMQIQGRLDHSIRVPRPDQSVTLGVPNACNGCHTDKDARWAAGKVRAWYPKPPHGYQHFADAFSADERNTADAPTMLDQIARSPEQPAFIRASALARLASHPGTLAFNAAQASIRDSNALVRLSALEVLDAFPPEQRAGIATPLLKDSSRAVRLEAARLLAGQSKLMTGGERETFARAAAEFIASERYNADRPENRATLGIFFAALGRLDEATKEYRGALRIAPMFAPAYINLADLLRAEGREPDAEKLLREGLALVPADAALHHALGLSLARSGRLQEALTELGRSADLAPRDARFAYAYAVGLQSAGRKADALRAVMKGRDSNPDDRNLLFALATFHRDDGNRTEALSWARVLSSKYPADSEAHALVQSLQ